MSEIYHRWARGEVIPSTDLATDAGLRLYGEVMHFEWKKDRTTAQLGIDGELYYQNHYPIETLTPEQQHLKRPSDNREGRRQSEIEALDQALEQQRIADIRAELQRPAGWGQVATSGKASKGWGSR